MAQNSTKSVKPGRGPGKPFEKGVSGNPGGRPRLPEELRDRIRGLSEKAVNVLEQSLDSPEPRVALMAAQILLDRGYGKPSQQTDLTLTTAPAPDEEPVTTLQLAREIVFALHLGMLEAKAQEAAQADPLDN